MLDFVVEFAALLTDNKIPLRFASMQATDLERKRRAHHGALAITNFDGEVSVGSVPAASAKILSCHFNQRPRGLVLHRVHRCKVQPFLVANEVAAVTDIEKVSTHLLSSISAGAQ
jgi:hypothetical protein